MLKLSGVCAGYGQLQVLRDVSIEVGDGEFVAILGPNGAGKTTTLRTVVGLIHPTRGEVWFNGERIDRLPAEQRARRGLAFVPEDNRLFEGMTVLENLLVGAYGVRDPRKVRNTLAMVVELFPWLQDRRGQFVATLSGGERKMLAIARGLMSRPRLLLVDEPSLGLAPRVVVSLFEMLVQLNREGITILLVEQNANMTLRMVHRAYVMERGTVVLADRSEALFENPHVREAYLGGGSS